jgi:hypothetical protein
MATLLIQIIVTSSANCTKIKSGGSCSQIMGRDPSKLQAKICATLLASLRQCEFFSPFSYLSIPNTKEAKFLATLDFRPTKTSTWLRFYVFLFSCPCLFSFHGFFSFSRTI